MSMHVLEWISNLLSFVCLVFADVFLRSTRTVRVILGIFIQAWTTRASCRFLPSACIVTATNLRDFRMSLILENKILKKETLKTTQKSSFYFTQREQCFQKYKQFVLNWGWNNLPALSRVNAVSIMLFAS